MLLKRDTLEGIGSGAITLVFRRWRRPTVRSGGTLRTRIGVLAIASVDRVSISSITVKQAEQAGFSSRAELVRELETREGTTYRIAVRLVGDDPRIALRGKKLSAGDLRELERRLARMDRASRDGPWTRSYLELIEARSGVRAPDLAASVGQETRPFKQRVRRLKELGLTESLKVGYRISPRGKSYLKS